MSRSAVMENHEHEFCVKGLGFRLYSPGYPYKPFLGGSGDCFTEL